MGLTQRPYSSGLPFSGYTQNAALLSAPFVHIYPGESGEGEERATETGVVFSKAQGGLGVAGGGALVEGLKGGGGRGWGAGEGNTPEARTAAGLDEKGHGPACQQQLAAPQAHGLDGAAALAVYSWLQRISPTQEADSAPVDAAVGAL